MAGNNVPSALDKEQIFGMAEKEMEYRVELFNKLTNTCFNKCVEKKYKESELNMGENSCIDRCVSKYWQVNSLIVDKQRQTESFPLPSVSCPLPSPSPLFNPPVLPHTLAEMPYTRRERTASPQKSVSPIKGRSRSRSGSPPRRRNRSRSRSRESEDASNPGNNLYVTGLSTRVTASDIEKFFSREGKVLECNLVKDPRSKESRGFAFVTMESNKDAERCIKYLDRSVLEGRLITVEMAKRKRGRSPTPGKYLGSKERQGRDSRRRSRSYSPRRRRDDDSYRRDRDRRDRSLTPRGRREEGDRPDSHRRRRERSVSR
ncbi:hypothetical protein MLD38_018469 [Melastoma candidum]|uniref:Uncharacterized protein n=1 Tax=Melastoma candidum TaxID=119954 RepID=A0ACB9QX22_9MYRT|nr:hypothetical protein MLD38_018469 [Melastoma candidum]